MGKQIVVISQYKPDGTLQKLLDISQIKKLGLESNIVLIDGIRKVYEWYLQDQKTVFNHS